MNTKNSPSEINGDEKQIQGEPSTLKNQTIDEIYQDYLQETQRLVQEFQKPVRIIMVPLLIYLVVYYYNLLSKPIYYRSSNLPLLICIGIELLVYFIMLKRITDKAVIIAKDKTGLDKFLRSYLTWGVFKWPKKLAEGRKREEFLTIIGKK